MVIKIDFDLLVSKVTAEVMKIINEHVESKTISIISEKTENELTSLLENNYNISDDYNQSDYFILSKEKYNLLLQTKDNKNNKQINDSNNCSPNSNCVIINLQTTEYDFTQKKVLQEKDLKNHQMTEGSAIKIRKSTIVTSLAKDFINYNKIKVTII